MAESYLTLTNKVISKLNEVALTSANFTSARGIQIQCQDAINEAIRYINQTDYNYPFNHATANQTLTAGVVRYSLPSSTKVVDYNTFRLVKDSDLSSSGGKLKLLNYNDYIDKYITQEDEINSTTLSQSHTDSVTTITVASTSGFDASGTLYIGNEIVSYTAIGSSTTFTGVTRGSSSTTAAAHANAVVVTQFNQGSIPQYVARTPDNNYLLYPYPTKSYQIDFEYYTFPTDLTAHGDTTTIPDRFAHVIVTGAMAFVYQYRGEIQQHQVSMQLFEDGIKNMQSLLVNRFDYLRSTYPLGGSSSSRANVLRVS
jgi:hypothetical protein|tara:strand:- start:239 stop:1177 length:939 start_codon:yes stop_codon:yes gene_type:complete